MARFIFKSGESGTSQEIEIMFGWSKFTRRRIECESWAPALATPRAQAYLDFSGEYPTREEELEFLLSEAKKEVQTKQEWIDMCHDVHIKQAEALRKKKERQKKELARMSDGAARKKKLVNDTRTRKPLATLSHAPVPEIELPEIDAVRLRAIFLRIHI